jgi:hypothetical protein
MKFIFLSLISLIYKLYHNQTKILADTSVLFEHGKAIKCNFKPGSVKRFIGLNKEGYTSAAEGRG